jgi:cell division septation protein DedD
MKSRVVATVTAASAMILSAHSALLWALVLAGAIALVLIAVVVVPAVHSAKASKKKAAQEVLCILLGRPRG